MLTEFQDVKQYPGEHFRRWFQDDYFDVIIWLEADRKDVFGFQLCYDVEGDEHCLTWKKDSGFVGSVPVMYSCHAGSPSPSVSRTSSICQAFVSP